MRESILPVLACPRCKGALTLEAEECVGENVTRGVLRCSRCSSTYRIIACVPDMRVPEAFGLKNLLMERLYTIYSPLYDVVESRLMSAIGLREHEMRRHLISLMRIRRGDRVLEVCVGTGANVPYMLEAGAGEVFGLDISPGMLAQCVRRVRRMRAENVHLVLGCDEYLPFKDETFDRVFIGGGVTYFPSPKLALEEAARVTRRGGLIVVYEQVTLLEKALRSETIPVRFAPSTAELIIAARTFGEHAWVAVYVKR